MKHISEALGSILPFKLDNIREMTPEELAELQVLVNDWLRAKFLDMPANAPRKPADAPLTASGPQRPQNPRHP